MNFLGMRSWSPYLVGALIGVLSWFSFASVDRPLGITTAFEDTAALAVQAAAPAVAENNAYYEEEDEKPKIDREWMLVVGVFIGAWLSSKLSGDRGRSGEVPPRWRRRFGPGTAKRYAGAFFGGMLLMLGARLAQGCTSGHGLRGALQLAVSSWRVVAVFVSAGIAAAFGIYGSDDKGGRHG